MYTDGLYASEEQCTVRKEKTVPKLNLSCFPYTMNCSSWNTDEWEDYFGASSEEYSLGNLGEYYDDVSDDEGEYEDED